MTLQVLVCLVGLALLVLPNLRIVNEGERVVVRTNHAMEFYRELPSWVLQNDLKVDEILTLDDSLEAVFQYLTER